MTPRIMTRNKQQSPNLKTPVESYKKLICLIIDYKEDNNSYSNMLHCSYCLFLRNNIILNESASMNFKLT